MHLTCSLHSEAKFAGFVLRRNEGRDATLQIALRHADTSEPNPENRVKEVLALTAYDSQKLEFVWFGTGRILGCQLVIRNGFIVESESGLGDLRAHEVTIFGEQMGSIHGYDNSCVVVVWEKEALALDKDRQSELTRVLRGLWQAFC